MFLARTAAAYGAHVATRARVVGLLKEAGRVVGATVQDLESGERVDVRAKQVINATGVWTDETQGLAGERGLLIGIWWKLVVPRSDFCVSR